MRLQSSRGVKPLSTSPKRSFPWARTIIIAGVLAIAAYLIVPNFFYVRADALVKGFLVPVAPLYRVRVDRLLAGCADHVRAGQPVAMVSNFLEQEDYQRQYLESLEQLQLSKVGLIEHVEQAQTNASSLYSHYLAAALDSKRLGDEYHSYDAAYRQDAVPLVDLQEHYTAWRTAVAGAQSAQLAWQRAEKDVARLSSAENQRIASSQELAQVSQVVAQRVGGEPLTAPVSGYVVNCIERPQNVLNPGSPLFDIFQPETAYVLAYYSPNAISKIEIGDRVDLRIYGIRHVVKGRVVSIYPDLVALPSELTRFFWQHVQWEQFRPVRISLDTLSASDRAKLYYDAQARATITLNRTGDTQTVSQR